MSDYMKEYKKKNKAILAAKQRERDRIKREERLKDPVKLQEYREKRAAEWRARRPGAMTMQEYNELRKARKQERIISELKQCLVCGEKKEKKEFTRHGPGYKSFCKSCEPEPKPKKVYPKKKKEAPVFDILESRVNDKVKEKDNFEDYFEHWVKKGWRLVWAFGEGYNEKIDQIFVFIRKDDLAYVRPHGNKVRYSKVI